jgi:lipoprotein-anchoring transpeptidase ErfK/SrfK
MITPAVAGTWSTVADAELFTPASTLAPCSTYQLTVWSKTAAVGQASLGARRTLDLHVACPSVRASQQSLARLGYLPYHFKASSSSPATISVDGAEPRGIAALQAFKPPAGHLSENFHGAPKLAYGQLDTVTKGAVMRFQAVRGIEVTGVADARTWASLLAAETVNSRARTPYTFVTVSESQPESLEVHVGSHIALRTPTNTGVAGAETAQGVFPIFARYVATTMIGTNPDGTKYNDPGVPWVNYFNGGDAVHGFPRPSYGSPQSNGCVELPIETARTVYGMLAIGDIVEVS